MDWTIVSAGPVGPWGIFLGGTVFGLFLGYLWAIRIIRRPQDAPEAGAGERKEPPGCP